MNIANFLRTALFIEKRCFPVKFSKVLRTACFDRTPLVAASEQIQEISVVHCVAK